MSRESTALFSLMELGSASVSSIVHETNVSNIAKMLSIPRTIIFTIIQKFKKSGNAQRKPQHGPEERSDQRTLGKLMGATGTRGNIYNAIGL